MSRTFDGSTGEWAKRRARILADSDVCHICGHAGSDAVDHIIPVIKGGSNDMSNLKPAHHTADCPTCGKKCNRVKGDRDFAPIVRRSGSLRRP